MPVTINKPSDISPAWMTQQLKGAGLIPNAEVSGIDYQLVGTGKMGDNARLKLSYNQACEGAPQSVIAKLPSLDEGTRAKASASGAYYSEVMFYQKLAGQTSMRTPKIYGSELSDDRQHFVLIMEDMAPAEPGDQLIGETRERCVLAMQEAAKLAAAFYGNETIAEHDFVITAAKDDGGAFGQALLQEYWPQFLTRFGDQLDNASIAFGDRYVDRHQHFVCRLQGPKTLVHGDFRSENILFTAEQACTVDWQTVSQSNVMTDLAYFLGGSITVENRRLWERDLVAEYSEQIAALGVNIGFDACWEQYREQAMHGLLITILGACFSEPEPRGDAMFTAMIQRHLQHCIDLDAGAFLQ